MQNLSTGSFIGIILLFMAGLLFVLVSLPILSYILIGVLICAGAAFLLLGVLRG